MTRTPLAVLAVFLDRLEHHVAAATIAGFALSPFTVTLFREITTAIAHLRDVLGDETYESLGSKGERMTTAEMVAYAYDQIDQVRAELKRGLGIEVFKRERVNDRTICRRCAASGARRSRRSACRHTLDRGLFRHTGDDVRDW